MGLRTGAPSPRLAGMPESVETPAPVSTATRAPRIRPIAASSSSSVSIGASRPGATVSPFDGGPILDVSVFRNVSAAGRVEARGSMHIERGSDAASDAVADYARLTDVSLRSAHEPANGLYIAESAKVIRRAIGAGHRPRSVLMEEKWLPGLEGALAPFDVPVPLADPDQLEAITGYRVHRGALAAFERPILPDPAALLA